MPSANWRYALDVHPRCPGCFMLLSSELDKFALVPHNQRWARMTFGSNFDWSQHSVQRGVLVIYLCGFKTNLSMIYMRAGFGLGGWMSHLPWAGINLALDDAGFWSGYRSTCKLKCYMTQAAKTGRLLSQTQSAEGCSSWGKGKQRWVRFPAKAAIHTLT